MFSNIPVMKFLVLLCFIAAATAQPIFFGHGKQTQIFITPRKDTVSTTLNQIPTSLVKPKPAIKINVPVQVQVPVQKLQQIQQIQQVQQAQQIQKLQPVPQVQPLQQVQVPVQQVQHLQQLQQLQQVQQAQMPAISQQIQPITVTNPKTPYEVNKLFNEMKNSKKPFMTISMKAPPKSSMFPDPFSLFDDDNSEHIVVHVPYNVHTHNIHHHHIQTVPVYKHIPVIKHVPVHVVKEVAIPVHLTQYKEGWNSQAQEGWHSPAQEQWW